jgi:uncharacterized NAD(P)/FAD-binding protein YdhS
LEVRGEHKVVLRRLYFDRRIGERHTSIVHLKKGLPPKFQKSVDKAIKDLIKNGYIVIKKTGYGIHVSLNVNMIPEIEGILGIDS